MIIRRIAQGIKDQDWFVVSVEILIVVIGIFIGLQVDDWNEARKDKEKRIVYLERLYEDLKEDFDAMGHVGRVARERLESIEYLVQVAGQPDLAAEKPEYFIQSLYHARLSYGLVSTSTTFDELRETGQLDILNDDELEDELIYYYRFAKFREAHERGERVITQFQIYTSGLIGVERMQQVFRFSREELELPPLNISPEEALRIAEEFASRKNAVDYLDVVAENQLHKMRLVFEEGKQAREMIEKITLKIMAYGRHLPKLDGQ